jgi:hypothetical protein
MFVGYFKFIENSSGTARTQQLVDVQKVGT